MNSAVNTRHFDIFNGDADGLCALHQLRLAQPRATHLLSGVKRDHALLGRVDARPGDSITVLDLPLAANRAALLNLLDQGVAVDYFDHHSAAPPPDEHPLLRLYLDPAPGTCTSLLVNRHLDGRFAAWAVVGAFGDNQAAPAHALAASLGLGEDAILQLKILGECLNYNAYGDSEADLLIPPTQLYKLMAAYPDPLDFIEQEPICLEIDQQWTNDLTQAMAVKPILDRDELIVVQLPAAAWARRVLGSYANRLAQQVSKVCAVVAPNTRHTLTVSLRAPMGGAYTADQLVCPFGGAGRATAAGINDLLPAQLPVLIQHWRKTLGMVDTSPLLKSGPKSMSTETPMPCHAGDALLVVDVQNDFLPGGRLPVPNGDQVIAPLNQWMARFSAAGLPVFASRCWHPPNHASFRPQGGTWPAHCVADTVGAAFASGLDLPDSVQLISKAGERDIEAYSAFAGTDLDNRLHSRSVHRLFIGGLATDYCVLRSVQDALHRGYQVVLLRDAIRAVEVQAGDGERAIAAMLAAGAVATEG